MSEMLAVPEVPLDSVRLVRALGAGRCGVVHVGEWRGREVAVKQFDLDHGAEKAWNSELSAYARLRKAWGELVPRPLFTSTSFSGAVRFLGLQLGHSRPRDAALKLTFCEDMYRVLSELRERFGFEHLDPEPRNFVYLDCPADGGEASAGCTISSLDSPSMVASSASCASSTSTSTSSASSDQRERLVAVDLEDFALDPFSD
jgi:hypothetical protein